MGLSNSNVPVTVSELSDSVDSTIDIGNEVISAGEMSLLVWIEQVVAYIVKLLKFFVC